MKYCPNCNYDRPDRYIFCHTCGTKLENITKLCRGCDTVLDFSALYCHRCGKRWDDSKKTHYLVRRTPQGGDRPDIAS